MHHNHYSNRWDRELLGSLEFTQAESLPLYLLQSRKAYQHRSTLAVSHRVACLRNFLVEYQSQAQVFATVVSKEIGKPITQSFMDHQSDIEYIQRHLQHAEEILKPQIIYEDEHSVHTQYFDPKGVVGVISPRNFPTTQLIRETIPTLIAWNTVIYKASESCAYSGYLLGQLLQKHLPQNVFIPLHGWSDIGQALVELDTDMTVFTGSSRVWYEIVKTSANSAKPSHLELWWSAPGIILPWYTIDNNLMQTIDLFRVQHGGQICDGLKRLFVHESQHQQLIRNISEYFESFQVWNPLDPHTNIGCLISEQALDTIQWQLADARDKWGKLIELGKYDGVPWPFMPFTLVIDPSPDMKVMQEEAFGPVLPIMQYQTIDQTIQYANDTVYGLWGYIWWHDDTEINYVCSKLQTGNINVNNTNYVIPQVPFGGYKPMSGNFREHGIIWLRNYTETKVVSRPK